MSGPPGSRRRPKRGSSLWDSRAFLAACETGLTEYLRVVTGGSPQRILDEFWRLLSDVEQQPFPQRPTSPPDESALIGHVSNETLKQIHRLIVKDLHPDRGGDAEAMKQANRAWEALKKKRGM